MLTHRCLEMLGHLVFMENTKLVPRITLRRMCSNDTFNPRGAGVSSRKPSVEGDVTLQWGEGAR